MNKEIQRVAAENLVLKSEVERLTHENHRLLSRNLSLSEQQDAWHETRRRVEVLSELMLSDRRRMATADLRDDTELLALLEARVESQKAHLDPAFDAEALARMLNVTPSRLVRLFRNNTPHHSPEDYINFRRVLSAMELLRQHPNYSVAAISAEAGFASVRTFQRRMQEAIGLTPVEYRKLFEE